MWTEENRREVRRPGVRIWDYVLNYSMLSRKNKFSRFREDQREGMYQVREEYFRLIRRILGGGDEKKLTYKLFL